MVIIVLQNDWLWLFWLYGKSHLACCCDYVFTTYTQHEHHQYHHHHFQYRGGTLSVEVHPRGTSIFSMKTRFAPAKWQVCAQLVNSPFYTICHNKLHRYCACLINYDIYWIDNNNINHIYVHMLMHAHNICIFIFAQIQGVGEIDQSTGTPSITTQILC